MADKYIYAVARIRALEMSLFSQAVIEQLIAQKTYADCLQFLGEKGWGDTEAGVQDAETILNRELEKTWTLVKEMVSDQTVFDVLLIQDSFHNLKAAIKTVVDGEVQANIFYDNASVSGEALVEIIKDKDFRSLPESMRECALEAYECLVHTGDGQMCDVIIDRAAMRAMLAAAEKNGDALLKEYAETVVAVANIKIAVRSVKTEKGLDFMRRAMEECQTLNVERLMRAALSGMPDVIKYLEETPYSGGAAALSDSSSAFERWCDNRIIEAIRPQKYNSFTIGPLVAYVLARQNEIKTVRIILTGKLNHLPDDAIRKCMYRIAVLGEYDSIYGFATLGLETFPVSDAEQGSTQLRRLAESGYAVIYVTESMAEQIKKEIERYKTQMLPAIILIPGVSGNTSAGINGVKKSVEQAVGSDILFSGN